MNIQPISVIDLGIAAFLVCILALVNHRTSPQLSKDIFIAMIRLVLQLSLIALVLKYVFAERNILLIGGLGLVMVALAGYEVKNRISTGRTLAGTFWVSSFSMFISSYVICIFCLLTMIKADPWYHPQYAIPLLGMLLGNTLTGVSLSLNRLRDSFKVQRTLIESRLMLGEDIWQATLSQRREAMTSALIPTINSMAAAGIVSLPGMMTGQILAGADPELAVRYQIMIFLLIAAGTGFGTYLATYLGSKQLFDDRERLISL
ncbi:MAG: iron export ABC transporter permease subunit FetB [Pseudomonadales bacterium]|nr:iron export ABC transporter permease subunit FetB [Pseudomonadales bacterium]